MDPASVRPGLELATRMILDLCGGEAGTVVQDGAPIDQTRSYQLNPARVVSLVGMEIPEATQRTPLEAVRRIEVKLYGSLSATGVGHATDRAVIAGLMGARPDEVDPDFLVDAVDSVRIDGALPLPGGVVTSGRAIGPAGVGSSITPRSGHHHMLSAIAALPLTAPSASAHGTLVQVAT